MRKGPVALRRCSRWMYTHRRSAENACADAEERCSDRSERTLLT